MEKETNKDVIAEAVAESLRIFEERQETKAKEEEALVNAAKAQQLDELLAEKEKEVAWSESKKSVHVKKESKAGFSDEDKVMFDFYLRGKESDAVVRKALQEGDGGEGGFLVPNDYYSQMIELRDQASFPRRMGVQQITTVRDNIDIPAEGTSYTKFVRTAEEGSYSTNDPAFVQNNVIPQKWTKLTKLSDELVADEAYDLIGFLTRAMGRAMAQTENYYVAIGSGTNQHEGIFEGGDTDALTFDSTGNITPDEIWELFYTLGAGYRGQASWLMDDQTWRYILSIRDANNWAFAAADMATIGAGSAQPDGMLCGKPVFLQDDIPGMTTGNGVIAVGDPFYYALVDRQGLEIKRLDELYAETGQIGYRANFRQSGKVLYSLAWCIGAMA